jgi:hypothetical protein
MGKKILVHYKPEGSSIREIETSTLKILCVVGIALASIVYTVFSAASHMLSFASDSTSIAASTTTTTSPRQATPERKTSEVLASTSKKQKAVEPEISKPEISKPEISKPEEIVLKKADFEVPVRQDQTISFENLKTEEDGASLYVHYDIVNNNKSYAKGYTYGIAVYRDAKGNETVVTSHPGIDPENPFSRRRLIAGNSYGARRFTPKSINFQKPKTPGRFVTGWVVASRDQKLTYKTWAFEDL